MSRIFVDTSALIALLDRADPRHEAVRSVFCGFVDEALVTHGYVIAETLAVARRRFGVDAVIALLDDLLPVITVLPVELPVHAAAQTRYRASLPSGTSFVDQISFGVIEQHQIETAFALNSDFAATGAEILPAP